ncbi:hypothetical protein Q8A73_001984 [Channa argus]|nr:hypothetical protein Q8A73_001984 [Channa argus]
MSRLIGVLRRTSACSHQRAVRTNSGQQLSHSCHVCIENRLRSMCESKTPPDWLWPERGHLMRSVNTGISRMNTRFNQVPSDAGWGRHRTSAAEPLCRGRQQEYN